MEKGIENTFKELSDEIKELKEKEAAADLSEEEKDDLSQKRIGIEDRLKKKLEHMVVSFNRLVEDLTEKQKDFKKELKKTENALEADKQRLEQLMDEPEENKDEIELLEKRIADSEELFNHYNKVLQKTMRTIREKKREIRDIQKKYDEYLPEELKYKKKEKSPKEDESRDGKMGASKDNEGEVIGTDASTVETTMAADGTVKEDGEKPDNITSEGTSTKKKAATIETDTVGADASGTVVEGTDKSNAEVIDDSDKKTETTKTKTPFIESMTIAQLEEEKDKINDLIDAAKDDAEKAKLIKARDEINEKISELKKTMSAAEKGEGSTLPAKTFEQILEENCNMKVSGIAKLFRNMRNIALKNDKGRVKLAAPLLAIPKAIGFVGDLALGGDRNTCAMQDKIKGLSDEEFEILRKGLEDDPSKSAGIDPIYVTAVENRVKEHAVSTPPKNLGDDMSSMVRDEIVEPSDTKTGYVQEHDYEQESPDDNYYI